MNAGGFRKLFEYHFAANRKVWDQCVAGLTDEQYTRQLDYSVGSVRNQVVHLYNIDDRWFSGLRGVEIPRFLNPVHFPRRDTLRQRWDETEAAMRTYLTTLTDKDLSCVNYDPLTVWEVLFHILNHGTDHRAQLLAALHQLGVTTTFPQDYVFFAWGKL